jgi:predicted nucleic acid-binding Zn ribbon protein
MPSFSKGRNNMDVPLRHPATSSPTGAIPFLLPVLLVILVILALLLIVILVRGVARRRSESSHCPACGTRLRVRDRFCQHCGSQLDREAQRVSPASDQLHAPTVRAIPTPIAPAVCPSCSEAIQAGDVFCGSCGNLIISSTTQTQRIR